MRLKAVAAIAAALSTTLLVGCTSPEEEPEAEATAGATSSPAEESGGAFPAVLSETMADTGEPMTALEIAALASAGGESIPEGYRNVFVVVDAGLGSFSLATPERFSVPWRWGTPTDELVQDLADRDPFFARFWEPRLVDDENPRAMAIDLEEQSSVIMVQATLAPDFGERGDELARAYADMYSERYEVTGSQAVKVNGVDGAYVEFVVPSEILEGGSDRVQMQVLIPDPPNETLWGVTCDSPPEFADEVRADCAGIAATFKPLPAVVPEA